MRRLEHQHFLGGMPPNPPSITAALRLWCLGVTDITWPGLGPSLQTVLDLLLHYDGHMSNHPLFCYKAMPITLLRKYYYALIRHRKSLYVQFYPYYFDNLENLLGLLFPAVNNDKSQNDCIVDTTVTSTLG